jgi:hypothetical protein
MKKLFMILPLVFLLCFTFSCQKAEEVLLNRFNITVSGGIQ